VAGCAGDQRRSGEDGREAVGASEAHLGGAGPGLRLQGRPSFGWSVPREMRMDETAKQDLRKEGLIGGAV
jgi:hypothetical protein